MDVQKHNLVWHWVWIHLDLLFGLATGSSFSVYSIWSFGFHTLGTIISTMLVTCSGVLTAYLMKKLLRRFDPKFYIKAEKIIDKIEEKVTE